MTGKKIIAICAGFGAGIWFCFEALKQARALNRAAWWPSVQGRILESALVKAPDGRHTHFLVRYEFTIGERIESTTPRLCGDWFWNNKLQQAFIDRYQPGQTVEVFYEPNDPRQNCLDRNDRSGIVAMAIISISATTLATILVWLDRLKSD